MTQTALKPRSLDPVYDNPGGEFSHWAVYEFGKEQPLTTFDTKRKAVKWAKSSKNGLIPFVDLHTRSGAFQRRWLNKKAGQIRLTRIAAGSEEGKWMIEGKWVGENLQWQYKRDGIRHAKQYLYRTYRTKLVVETASGGTHYEWVNPIHRGFIDE